MENVMSSLVKILVFKREGTRRVGSVSILVFSNGIFPERVARGVQSFLSVP